MMKPYETPAQAGVQFKVMDPSFRWDFKISLFLVLFFLASPAQAQEAEKSLLCHHTVVAIPRADVAYQPGVDVHGKAVVPADMNAPIITPPKVIEIPLTADLAQWAGLTLPSGTKMESVMGFIEAYPDGKILWNGQDITQNIAQNCSRIRVH
jgi:hypothetical protein